MEAAKALKEGGDVPTTLKRAQGGRSWFNRKTRDPMYEQEIDRGRVKKKRKRESSNSDSWGRNRFQEHTTFQTRRQKWAPPGHES